MLELSHVLQVAFSVVAGVMVFVVTIHAFWRSCDKAVHFDICDFIVASALRYRVEVIMASTEEPLKRAEPRVVPWIYLDEATISQR